MGIFGKRGAVRVALERNVLGPGETLVGTVFLMIDKPVKSACLKVLVLGQEVMMWKRKVATSTVYHCKTKDYVKEEINLTEEKTPMAVGEAEYRFVYQIPLDAHQSFSYAAKNVRDLLNVNVNVEYKVDVVLEVDGLGSSNLKGGAVFTVDSPTQQAPQPSPISVSHAGNVAFLSVFKRGSCELTLDISTNVFVPSSTIDARVGLSLESSSSLKYIDLILYEDAVVDRRDAIFKGLKRDSRVVTKRRFNTSDLGQPPYSLALPLTPNEISNDKPLNPTMMAHFLTVQYRVAVECHFSMAGNVAIDAPVTLVRETAHVPGYVGPPLGEMAFEAAKMLVGAIAG